MRRSQADVSPSQDRSPAYDGADYGRSSVSVSRSRSKSRPRVVQPRWMSSTDDRLTAAVGMVEEAAEKGGSDLQALYAMRPADISRAASSQPHASLAETPQAKSAVSSQPPESHHMTALRIHRVTGGGPKHPSSQSGPIATSLNPARHAMMINGRPVVVLRVVEALKGFNFEPY